LTKRPISTIFDSFYVSLPHFISFTEKYSALFMTTQFLNGVTISFMDEDYQRSYLATFI